MNCTTWLGNTNDIDTIKNFRPDKSKEKFIVLFPDSTHVLDTSFEPLTPQFIKHLHDTGIRFYVYGMVEYDDIFKIHHWTKFCWDTYDQHSFNATTFGNACDEN